MAKETNRNFLGPFDLQTKRPCEQVVEAVINGCVDSGHCKVLTIASDVVAGPANQKSLISVVKTEATPHLATGEAWVMQRCIAAKSSCPGK